MIEQTQYVKLMLTSIEKELDELVSSTHPRAGLDIANLLVEKAHYKANPQEEWKCHYPTHPRPGRR